ncbi:hypothetical protein [Bradyrhizobium septentrionale]|uniref:Uncharacterized protein n=1 Tax=Bradyrhizobium septentrionale TaxID=1404411 RepID=A0A973VVS1_9BRAD|nr:hypothetical protein [Bradyrhizobium septentrionale]UGY20046.1 hypothetical protein HAP48_0022780 [Bradyrhizobium septentrionale]UGY28828.1 hypothetical protein HU675_0019775 [Bradyrhizobium septentrionale]
MAWKDFGSSLAITRRRRAVATALMYGLTLTVRFTTATGDDADATAQAAHGVDPMTSVMINNAAQAVTRDLLPGAAQPISFHRGSLPGARGCRAACGPALRSPFVSGCAARQ